MHVEYVTIEREQDYDWWRNQLAGKTVEFHDDDAHAGYFVAERLVPKSMAYRLPVAIYWSGPVDDTGSLVGDCELQAALAGHACDAYGLWLRVAHKPISDTEYNELMEQNYDGHEELIRSIVAACGNS